LDAAIDLAVPPLGLLAGGTLALTAAGSALAALGLLSVAAIAPSAVAALGLILYVLLGLRAGRVPAATYRALLFAPALVASDLITRSKLLGGSRANTWQRTARPGDETRHVENRPEIAGIPIDRLNLDEALGRSMSAVTSQSF